MDRREKQRPQSSKKLKLEGIGYEQTIPVPSELTSMFSPNREERSGSRYNQYGEYPYEQHSNPDSHYPQHQDAKEHHQSPYRSTDDYYAPERPHSGSDSMSPQRPPKRANTYQHSQNPGSHEYHEGGTPPHRSRSRRSHRPYPSPSRYPPNKQSSSKRSKRLPNVQHAPISYVCESARTCYPKTDLGKKIRDQVRSMTDGTRLVPAARYLRTEQLPILRGLVPEHSSHLRSRHHSRNDKTKHTLLLESTKDILEVHSVLGKGNFSRVSSITIKEPKTKDNDQNHRHSYGHRPTYYACKSIKDEILVSNVARMKRGNGAQSESYLQSVEFCVLAASQLAYEAHILSCLDHPNIVAMRGLDADGILGFEKRDHRGFFLLMDVLSETLDQKINNWRREKPIFAGSHHNNAEAFLLHRHQEKLTISLQLASALEYLHHRRVVYRDLKPSNVGFLADGWTLETVTNPLRSAPIRVQLFDFGLSRELTANQPTLRGAIGTMRYMAPEVCLNTEYDCDCDIYSYAILCWELWTQKIPFQEVATTDLYREQVCQMGFRPVYHPEEDPVFHNYSQQEQLYHHRHSQQRPLQTVPNEILVLLSQAWKGDPKARIRWPRIQNQLRLIDTLVSLQLEEHKLSSRVPVHAQPIQHRHDRPTHRATTEIGPLQNQYKRTQDNSSHFQNSEDSNKNNWSEPPRIENNQSFNLRDEDFDVDLGI